MTVISNLRGTSELNFRIGVTGPTIYTGNADPNVTGPTPIDTLNIGDVYFHSGSLGNPWFYDGTNWNQAVATGTGGTVISGDTTINGNLTVTGQGLFADGSTAAPSISFAADTDTGFYRRGNDQIGFVTGGAERFFIQGDELRGVNLRVRARSGNAALPTYTFDTDDNTGIYSAGPNTIGFTTGASVALIIDGGGVATFSDDVIVQGDLVVNGTTTTVNSANLNVTDNVITINDGEAGAGVSLGIAGIEVDRGTAPNASVLFDDALDEWRIGLSATPALAVRQPDGTRASLAVLSTDAFSTAAGTTAQRPTAPINGMSRYNTTLNTMEAYVNGAWESIPSSDASNTFILNTNNLSDLSNITTAINNLGLNSGGANDIWVDTAGDTMTGDLTMGAGTQVRFDDGTIAAPSITFGTDLDTGIFRTGTGDIGFSNEGFETVQFNNTSQVFTRSGAASTVVFRSGATGTGNIATLSFQGPNSASADTTMARITAVSDDVTAGAEEGRIDILGMESGTLSTMARFQDSRLRVSGSSIASPMFARINDTNSGLHLPGGDIGSLVAGGTEAIQWRVGGGTNASVTISTTDAIQMPSGTTVQRPTAPVNGMFRYNSSTNQFEGYENGTWEQLATTGGSGGTFLTVVNNLADLSNIATARTNLGLVAGGAGDIWVEKAGDTMSGNLDMGNNLITNVANPTSAAHVGDRGFNDARYLLETNNLSDLTNAATARTNLGLGSAATAPATNFVAVTGDSMTGNLNMSNSGFIINPQNPTSGDHVGDRSYNDARYLLEGNNLSDLTNAGTARNNLGLGSAATAAATSFVAVAGDTMTGNLTMAANIVASGNNIRNIGTSGARFNTVFASTFNGTATAALYADLAERYEADEEYPEGTLLVIGGDKEVTTTDVPAHHAVAGIVSLYPAVMMNNGDDKQGPTWPFVALAGRVPCRIVGNVQKGDRVGTSNIHGVGMSMEGAEIKPGTVVGIAMEDYNSDTEGLIEVMVRSS